MLGVMDALAPLIMVVDDEPQLAEIASIFLERCGYRTLMAHSGRQAEELWNNDIALVISDWMLPDSSGDQLALRLQARKPDLKIIFATGVPLASLKTSIPLHEGRNIIRKPYLPQELVQMVHTVLNRNLTMEPIVSRNFSSCS